MLYNIINQVVNRGF